VGAVNANLNGFAMSVYGGRAWFDRAGKASCTTPVASPPSSFPANEQLWFDDSVPAGAVLHGTYGPSPWVWDTTQKVSGAQSHTRESTRDTMEHWFDGATNTLTIGSGDDELFTYVLIDPCNPPLEIMLGWYDGSWEHRAYWGEDLINQGTAPTGRFYIGPLPAKGQWVKLSVPASKIGITGTSISGMYFATYAGKVWFDRAGKTSGGSAALRRQRNEPQYASLPFMASSGGPPTLTRYTLYTPELSLLAETQLTSSATPTIQYEYAWFGGQPVAQFTVSTTYWTFDDHLGTPILQTDSTGAVVWRAEHEPYGNVYKMRVAGNPHQPLRFPGQEDEQLDSGVNGATDRRYNVFRWYRASWGRYSQQDPLLRDSARPHVDSSFTKDSAAVTEPYTYALDNPIRLVDRIGLCSSTCPDCPNGVWAAVDRSFIIGVLFGLVRGQVTYFCTSARIRCSYDYSCTGVGLLAGAVVSVSTTIIGGSGCICASALPQVADLTVFAAQINAGPCTGGGMSGSAGLGEASVYSQANCSVSRFSCQRW